MDNKIFARYIDHTLLSPTSGLSAIHQLCNEAIENRFAAVCVPPCYVEIAKDKLTDSGIKIATVIGFPFGYNHTEAKATEIELAIGNGADELDMVINLIDLTNSNEDFLFNEINYCTQLCHERDAIIKIIIESGILSSEQIIAACHICADAGVDYVKTSTGYAAQGATIEAVQLMRKQLPSNVGIKASGGIKTKADALAFINAGATRIGTSNAIKMMKE